MSANLVGCESRACYVFHFSTRFNAILVVEGNGRAIESNWGINRAFQKFGGGIEKEVIVESGKI